MVPSTIRTPSMPAATKRGTGRPSDSSVRPEEYRSRIAPLIRPATATSTKGTRNQFGRMVARPPMGSFDTASLSEDDDAHRSRPYPISTRTGMLPPDAGQKKTPPVRVGGG